MDYFPISTCCVKKYFRDGRNGTSCWWFHTKSHHDWRLFAVEHYSTLIGLETTTIMMIIIAMNTVTMEVEAHIEYVM